MYLSKRLLEIISFVGKNSRVADIGTDHGYIPVYLIQNNISQKVIATDISLASLNKTVTYVNSLHLNDKIDTRFGDGLDVIEPNEVDTVIIAGMGGVLISKILDNNKEVCDTVENFILQPMVASRELRQYLVENGYEIVNESLAKEGRRFYEIIQAKRGKGNIHKDLHYDVGHKLIEKEHPLVKEFVDFKINEIEEILSKLGLDDTDKTVERRKELTKKLEEYKEVAKQIESN